MLIIKYIYILLEELLHKDTILSFGKDYPDKVFYVIRRDDRYAGIGSFLITNLGYISYAIRKNYIPIVDMQTYKNIYNKNTDINSWDIFFQQPCNYSLNDIKNAKNVIISPVYPSKFRPNDSMFYFKNKYWYLNYWKSVAKKYLKINDDIADDVECIWKSFSNNGSLKILGVKLRGTDYVELKPFGHPIQPTAEEIINKIEKINIKYHFDRILLSTEDKKIYDIFKNKYGEKLISYTKNYVTYDSNKGFINNSFSNEDVINGGLDYIKSILLLSKCNYLIASRNSGMVASMLFTNKIIYKYIFDLGEYK